MLTRPLTHDERKLLRRLRDSGSLFDGQITFAEKALLPELMRFELVERTPGHKVGDGLLARPDRWSLSDRARRLLD